MAKTLAQFIQAGEEMKGKDDNGYLTWLAELRVFCEQADCPVTGASLAALKNDIELGWNDVEYVDRRKEYKEKIIVILKLSQ